MNSEDVVLLVVDAYGGSMRGRTLLQKACYFVSVITDMELGYTPHYYGPYSVSVEEAVGRLRALGFLEEVSVGFGIENPKGFGELRRYDYKLTTDGKQVVNEIMRRNAAASHIKDAVDRIKRAGSVGYEELSLAAKTYFILSQGKKSMTPQDVQRSAEQLNWRLSQDAIDRAAGLLGRLDLVSGTS